MLDRAQTTLKSVLYKAFRIEISSSPGGPSLTVQPNDLIFRRFTNRVLLPISFGLCLSLSGCIGVFVSRSAALSLIASSNPVSLGSVPVGKTATATLSLVNENPVAVNITQLSLTGQSFSVGNQSNLPVSIAANSTYTLNIQFDPATPGPAAGQLTIVSDTSAHGTMIIDVSGVGAVAQPASKLQALSCADASLTGSGADACIVTISEAAPSGGYSVNLSSSNTAVSAPATLTIPENAASTQFTANVSSVATAQVATLTASAGGASLNLALQLNAYVPTLDIGATSLIFGQVPLSTPATQTLTLTSAGTAPVTISAVTPTGTGFSVPGATFPLTLNPGKSTTLTVQFDPTAAGTTNGQLTIVSNSNSGGSEIVSLTGTGEAPALSALSCASNAITGSGADVCTVKLSASAGASAEIVSLSSSNAAVSIPATLTVPAKATSAQFTANVSSVTTAKVATLTASAGGASIDFALSLNAYVPTLNFSANSLDFGEVPLSTPATQSLTLTSAGSAPVTITAATLTGTGFSVPGASFPLTLNPGKSTTLTVQFDPTATGTSSGQLNIASNGNPNTAVVSLAGTGEAPALSTFSCASNAMTASGTDLCTVKLSASTGTSAGIVSLSSSNAAVSIPSTVTVPANATSAQFTANVSSVETAQAATLTASAGGASINFALQLNAYVPTLKIGATSMAFGNVVVNAAMTQSVTLQSTGTEPVTISSAAVKGKAFTVSGAKFPIVLNPSQDATLDVEFDPTVTGLANGQLTITSDSSTSATTVIVLSGTAIAQPAFTYSGSPLVNTIVPPNPTTAISSDFFGMTIQRTATPFPAFPISTLRFWDVATWNVMEPSKGQFDWTKMDTQIAIGKENGVGDFIFTFGAIPAWASTNPTEPCTGGDGSGACAPPDMTAFDDFATQVVQRYCGTVKYYETWNEPNDAQYWSGTNAQLLTVAQHLYQVAKDPANCGCTNGVCSPNGGANPNQVLMPPISRINSNNLSWLDSYLAGTGAQYPYADVAAFHGYGSATDPEAIVTQVQSLKQTLAKHGLSNLQLWNTEASWGPITPVGQQQASWLMRYHVALATTGVSRFVWYAYDNCGWGTLWESTSCSNPQMPTGQLTDPGEAYAVMESWLSGANLPSCQQYENGLWACELQRAGSYDAWMLWSSTETDISVPIPADSGLSVYRDWQDNVNTLPTELTIGQMPVLLENHDL